MSPDGQSRGEHERRGRVWFALLGGGSAWTLHLLLAYVIAEFGCLSGLGEKHWAGLTIVAWLLLGLSVTALVLAAIAVRAAAQLRRGREDGGPESADALAFSGRLAWVTNLVFALVIAVQSVPILYFLGTCE